MRVLRRQPALWLATLLTSLVLLAPAAASADVRAGSGQDAQDTTPPLSGPRAPDVQSVEATYDTNGSFSVAVTLYEPWTQTTRAYRTFRASITTVVPLSATTGGYCGGYSAGTITVSGDVDPPSGAGYFEVQGFTGTLPLTRTFSADGRTTTFSGATPLLSGYDLGCVSSAKLYTPDPYGHCFPSTYDCQSVEHSYGGDDTPNFFFAGHAPRTTECSDDIDNDGDGLVDRGDFDCSGYDSPSESGRGPGSSRGPSSSSPDVDPAFGPTACSDGEDNDGDGKTDRKDPGCRDIALGVSEVDPRPVASRGRLVVRRFRRSCALETMVAVRPELLPRRLFPLSRATVSLRGVGGRARGFSASRKVRLTPAGGRTFKALTPGRYRVLLTYPGDPWRRASKASRTVRVC
jgi:hypothetical protein